MAVKNKIIIFVLILVFNENNGSENVPYWSEMARLVQLQTVDTRIIGGEDAAEGDAPWMVSMAYKSNDKHFCGGAIIGERTILSAAHCFVKSIDR